VKDHEWLLDGSPASDGEIHLAGLAVGCSVRTIVPARRHCASARTRNPTSAGLVIARSCFYQHRSGDPIDDLEDLTGGSAEKLIVR
jgi:hypothetical protein